MKIIWISSLIYFWGFNAFAIDLKPGESVVLEVNHPTEVRCVSLSKVSKIRYSLYLDPVCSTPVASFKLIEDPETEEELKWNESACDKVTKSLRAFSHNFINAYRKMDGTCHSMLGIGAASRERLKAFCMSL